MATPAHELLRHIRRLVSRPTSAVDSDAALLARFRMDRDEAAFATLVARHGGMVLAVCRRVLGDRQDAEDAAQATWLLLARKAHTIGRPQALAAWLHGVARNLALNCRRADERRQQRETKCAEAGSAVPPPDPLDELTARELLLALDEEVQALPKAYQVPLILCCLEGRTTDEAAAHLGWTPGSVRARLARGRKRLHARLVRRGLGLSVALAALEAAQAVASVKASGVLAGQLARVAAAYAAGTAAEAVTGCASAKAMALTEGMLRGMAMTKLKLGLALVLTVTMLAAGAGVVAHQALGPKQPQQKQEAEASAPAREVEQAKAEVDRPPPRTDRRGDPLPEGVVARLGTVRLRAVRSQVGLSRDGKTIVTVTPGGLVKLCDTDTGKLRGQRELPIQPSHEPLLSPGGRTLVVPEAGFFDIWDVTTGKRLRRFRAPERHMFPSGAFSPDGKRLAVYEYGPQSITIQLWDLETGKKQELKGKVQNYWNLAFSPDLLATSNGSHVICWDPTKGQELWRTKSSAHSLAFTPDGRVLIAAPSAGSQSWHAWDASTGRLAAGVKLPEGYPTAQLAVAPDGRTLVFAEYPGPNWEDGRVRLWDLRAGRLLRTLPLAGAIGPFAPDSRFVLTNNGALQSWDLATGKALFPDTDELGHRKEVMKLAYSPDGRRLASESEDGTVRLWEVATAKPLHVLHGKGRGLSGLAFTPDGRHLISGGAESELRVWDTEAGKEVRRIRLHDPKLGEKGQNTWRLHVTADGKTVVVLGCESGGRGSVDGILSSWELMTGQRKTRAGTGPSDGFYSAFSADGRLLVSCAALLDTATGKERVKLQAVPEPSAQYTFSPDGRLVAGLVSRMETDGLQSGHRVDGIQVWEAATGKARRRVPADRVGHPAFSPDGRYLAAADLDGLRLWELATGQVVLRHKAHDRTSGSYGQSFASCLAFAPDGRTLATGHLDATVLLWDMVPSGRPVAAKDLPRMWADLAGPDAVRAYAASWRLADAPGLSLPLLRDRLRPVKPAPVEQTRQLLADLDSDQFDKRRAAAERLGKLGDRAAGALREALEANPSLEKRRRLEKLLKALEESPSAEVLRQVRAVAVLERIGSPEAVKALQGLSEGDRHARLTQEAKAALQRLARRTAEGR